MNFDSSFRSFRTTALPLALALVLAGAGGAAQPARAAVAPVAAARAVTPETLSGRDRIRYEALEALLDEARGLTTDPEARTAKLREFLQSSAALADAQPQLLRLHQLRAITALEFDDARAGVLASKALLALGAMEIDDKPLRLLLGKLDLKGWLDAAEKNAAVASGQNFTTATAGIAMIAIAPGTFQMGSTDGASDEKPVTRVTLSRAFWMGKTEVTQAQWQTVMGTNPSRFVGAGRPVENVSYSDAIAFCRKLTEQERSASRLPADYAYNLPTEAQWEYACRAGTTGKYAGELGAMGWYGDNSDSTTHPVALKQSNAWGLHDMHGNVREWCLDWYAGSYSGGSATDPVGASSGSDRVYRGGSCFNSADYCLSAYRSKGSPGDRRENLGFRVALSLESELAQRGDANNLAQSGQNFTIATARVPMIAIAPGTFQMDSNDGQKLTRVTLSRGFWLGKTEVTQSQWEAVMGLNPSHFNEGDRPVENVSYDDAIAFCRKLTEQERTAGRLPLDYSYTLPTEAQWEYAGRAGTTGDYAGELEAMAWYTRNSRSTTHPVAQKQPNAWGLHDMHGNVWEWCLDWYTAYAGGRRTDPIGASGSSRVMRGGSWADTGRACILGNRYYSQPGERRDNLGFRLALSSSP